MQRCLMQFFELVPAQWKCALSLKKSILQVRFSEEPHKHFSENGNHCWGVLTINKLKWCMAPRRIQPTEGPESHRAGRCMFAHTTLWELQDWSSHCLNILKWSIWCVERFQFFVLSYSRFVSDSWSNWFLVRGKVQRGYMKQFWKVRCDYWTYFYEVDSLLCSNTYCWLIEKYTTPLLPYYYQL